MPRGPSRKIHLLLPLPSGIRRAGTTVSDEAMIQNAATESRSLVKGFIYSFTFCDKNLMMFNPIFY